MIKIENYSWKYDLKFYKPSLSGFRWYQHHMSHCDRAEKDIEIHKMSVHFVMYIVHVLRMYANIHINVIVARLDAKKQNSVGFSITWNFVCPIGFSEQNFCDLESQNTISSGKYFSVFHAFFVFRSDRIWTIGYRTEIGSIFFSGGYRFQFPIRCKSLVNTKLRRIIHCDKTQKESEFTLIASSDMMLFPQLVVFKVNTPSIMSLLKTLVINIYKGTDVAVQNLNLISKIRKTYL